MANVKHVVLTGLPGIGKTTLIKATCENLKELNIETPICGFYTEEVRGTSSRIGFGIVTLDGKRSTLARKSDTVSACFKKSNPSVGQYTVDVESFEKCALSAIRNHQPSDIVVLDEIGKMELFSSKFKTVVAQLFDQSDVRILATIPVSKRLKLVDDIRSRDDVAVIEVTKENRNDLKQHIVGILSHVT